MSVNNDGHVQLGLNESYGEQYARYFSAASQSEDQSNISEAWYYAVATVFPILMLGGIITNILGIVTIEQSRMWQRHEGFIYLTAIFIASIAILVFETGILWLINLDVREYPWHGSRILTIFLQYFKTVFYSCGWLLVALLYDVSLREPQTGRYACSPTFSAKYCTLRAGQIIILLVFLMIFVVFGLPYVMMAIIRGGVIFYGPFIPIIGLSGNLFIVANFIMMWVIPFIFFLPPILIYTMCMSRKAAERSVDDEQFRKTAVVMSSSTLLIQLVLVVVEIALQLSLYNAVRDGDNLRIVSIIGSFRIYTFVSRVILSLSLGAMPVICLVMMKQFKEEFCFQMGCCRRNSKNYNTSRQGLEPELQLVGTQNGNMNLSA